MKNSYLSAKPVNQLQDSVNAVDAAGFMLSFSRQLEKSEIQRLVGLESLLKEELPIFIKLGEVGISIQNDQVTTNKQQLSGVVLQCQTKEFPKKIEWSLEIHTNVIMVTCHKYDRWSTVLEKAIKFIYEGLSFIDLSSISITSVGFQIVDKFIYEQQPECYSIKDIFNEKSKFLPVNLEETDSLWHVFQGWFEKSDIFGGEKVLNQLNVQSTSLNEGLVSIVDHTVQVAFNNSVSVLKLFDKPSSNLCEIEKIYNFIHEKNISMIKLLLSDVKLKEIGVLND